MTDLVEEDRFSLVGSCSRNPSAVGSTRMPCGRIEGRLSVCCRAFANSCNAMQHFLSTMSRGCQHCAWICRPHQILLPSELRADQKSAPVHMLYPGALSKLFHTPKGCVQCLASQPSVSDACSRIDGRSSVYSGIAATPCNGMPLCMCAPSGQFDSNNEDACSTPSYLGVSIATLPGDCVE